MSGHTPGPWEIAPASDTAEVLDIVSEYRELEGHRVEANWIAECNLQEGIEENRANARLIAAAPDLLEELKESHNSFHSVRHGDGDCKTCAAIAKAEGR